mmetsp:Transcript_12618/g.24234  ORF Transcript_12618/g.24234 Transcript_12618/m.24234 type:complete len:208 (-) Transcript_12618:445-1068(-)
MFIVFGACVCVVTAISSVSTISTQTIWVPLLRNLSNRHHHRRQRHYHHPLAIVEAVRERRPKSDSPPTIVLRARDREIVNRPIEYARLRVYQTAVIQNTPCALRQTCCPTKVWRRKRRLPIRTREWVVARGWKEPLFLVHHPIHNLVPWLDNILHWSNHIVVRRLVLIPHSSRFPGLAKTIACGVAGDNPRLVAAEFDCGYTSLQDT